MLVAIEKDGEEDGDAGEDGEVLDTKLTAFVPSGFGVVVAMAVVRIGLKRVLKLGIEDGRGCRRRRYCGAGDGLVVPQMGGQEEQTSQQYFPHVPFNLECASSM